MIFLVFIIFYIMFLRRSCEEGNNPTRGIQSSNVVNSFFHFSGEYNAFSGAPIMPSSTAERWPHAVWSYLWKCVMNRVSLVLIHTRYLNAITDKISIHYKLLTMHFTLSLWTWPKTMRKKFEYLMNCILFPVKWIFFESDTYASVV